MCQFNARVRGQIDVEPAGRSTTESSWSQLRIGPQIFTEVPPAAVHLEAWRTKIVGEYNAIGKPASGLVRETVAG
jgi:hypothetical protein